ncbi:MAG TPA: pilus assembly protein N-terminal domain-containing protein [Myxococcaceae bacterium]|nr:pilus assembly protein N-terminal domain-containing protein [Myxococcaceae bacterium]
MYARVRRLVPGFLSGLAILAAATTSPAADSTAAPAPAPMYVAVDGSLLLTLSEAARKVAVANPAVADVQVISPSQLLVVGKTSGVTSLMIFSAKSLSSYNLIVHPSSLAAAGTSSTLPPPHAVLVQRGDKMSQQLFTQGPDARWLELGQVQPDTEVKK